MAQNFNWYELISSCSWNTSTQLTQFLCAHAKGRHECDTAMYVMTGNCYWIIKQVFNLHGKRNFLYICKKEMVLAKSHIIIIKMPSKNLYQSHYIVWKNGYFLTFNRLKGKQCPIICTLYAQKQQDRPCEYTVPLWHIHTMFIPLQLSEQPDNISLEESTFWQFNAASNNSTY